VDTAGRRFEGEQSNKGTQVGRNCNKTAAIITWNTPVTLKDKFYLRHLLNVHSATITTRKNGKKKK
jgi:hypothetical protein